MGGLFLDSLIEAIVKGVRRESRASTAESWPIADATIKGFGPGSWPGRIGPGITYAYEVNGETWYGSCMGYAFRDDQKASAAVNSLSFLRVRYDPVDPGESRVLNRDNPKLPFEIDHDPY